MSLALHVPHVRDDCQQVTTQAQAIQTSFVV